MGETDPPEAAAGDGAALRGRDPTALQAVFDIVDHAHPGKHAGLLEHRAAFAARPIDLAAVDHDGADRGREQPGHHAEKVLLPQPDVPLMQTNSPSGTVSERFEIA